MAGRLLVEEVLEDGGVEHSKTSDEEAGGDAFDRGEVDAALAEEGVDDIIEEGDEDDDGYGVEIPEKLWGQYNFACGGAQPCDVLNQIVGSAVELHASSDGAKISVNLRVAEPVEGEEEEYSACINGTGDFVDEFVIPSDLRRAFAISVVGYRR